MPTQRTLFLGCALFLGIAAIVLAAIALARVRELSLPLPASLPALNIALPLLAAITLPLFRSLGLKLRNHTSKLLPYLASVPSLAPFALFVLSLVYALPGDLQICAADQKWLKMFENKDVRGIRTIQTQLQCCGYNSMHDRAWPFPSRDTDARTCERTQGYNAACGNMWRQEETVAAVMSVIASFLNWLMMVCYWLSKIWQRHD